MGNQNLVSIRVAVLRHALGFSWIFALLASPTPSWGATAETLSPLNKLPRYALVIGNSRYSASPLKNPGNDALAIADYLKRSSFSVQLKLDASRKEMQEAIRAFGNELAQQKSVGVFYFAGHGAQLAWRNYLIPVDAKINQIADMQTQAVELGMLLDSLKKAGNPMNVVILDACRDNPFGATRIEQKGLSQIDAPPGTLLAYATSPGNVAADGLGDNGLYTEHLLKQILTREAKIEDVFKRVRLNVRIKSQGLQIPWESTSLEEDFYFIPPTQVRKLTEAEIEKQFEAEFAIWETIKTAKEVAPLEEYLMRYPNGKFSELAQFRMDRILTQRRPKAALPLEPPAPVANQTSVQTPTLIALAETRLAVPQMDTPNPYSKGTARVSGDYKVGDSYTYRESDLLTKVEGEMKTQTVTSVNDSEVIYNDGKSVRDLLGNLQKGGRGQIFTGNQIYIAEYNVGKKWTTQYSGTRPNGKPDEWTIDFKVVGKESITVPAGTFEAFRVEGRGYVRNLGATYKTTYWIAPDQVRRVIAEETEVYKSAGGKYIRTDREELVAFQQ